MNLSTEELKALNRKDESTALSAVPVVTVTEKNWKALLSLVSRLWERQEVTEELLRELMTYSDAENLLSAIDESSQEQLSRLQSEIVHEKEKAEDGTVTQQVDIYYKFIGLTISEKADINMLG